MYFLTLALTGLSSLADADRCRSAAEYFNLGNACYLEGKLAEAIFIFRRGLELDPNDAGLRFNLEYARARVANPFPGRGQPESDFWPTWLYQPSAWQTLIVALALYALALVLFTRWYMFRRRAVIMRAAVSLVLALLCGGYWLYLEHVTAWRGEHPLVVIRGDRVTFRRGDGPSYPSNPDLPWLSRGMEARKMHARGDWLQIQFASGEVGWVEKAQVLVD